MPIRDLCHQTVVSIDQHATLADAARLMRQQHVGSLVVTGAEDGVPQVVGIVTDRDLALDGLTRGAAAAELQVGALARRELVAVPAQADLAQAVQTMQQHGVRRLLVLEEDGRVAGVVSIDDLMEALALQMNSLAGALRSGVQRETRRPAAPAHAPAPVFMAMGTPGMH